MSVVSDREPCSVHEQAASSARRSPWEGDMGAAMQQPTHGYQLKLYRVMCTEWDFALRELAALAQSWALTKGNISWDVLQNVWVWHYSCNWLFAKCVKTKTSSL